MPVRAGDVEERPNVQRLSAQRAEKILLIARRQVRAVQLSLRNRSVAHRRRRGRHVRIGHGEQRAELRRQIVSRADRVGVATRGRCGRLQLLGGVLELLAPVEDRLLDRGERHV